MMIITFCGHSNLKAEQGDEGRVLQIDDIHFLRKWFDFQAFFVLAKKVNRSIYGYSSIIDSLKRIIDFQWIMWYNKLT